MPADKSRKAPVYVRIGSTNMISSAPRPTVPVPHHDLIVAKKIRL